MPDLWLSEVASGEAPALGLLQKSGLVELRVKGQCQFPTDFHAIEGGHMLQPKPDPVLDPGHEGGQFGLAAELFDHAQHWVRAGSQNG